MKTKKELPACPVATSGTMSRKRTHKIDKF